jgi:cold shock CspA family protein
MNETKIDTPLLTGKVKFFDNTKGFGFITVTGNGEQADVFLHISEVDEACDDPVAGDTVTFVIGQSRGRPAAKQIKIVGA